MNIIKEKSWLEDETENVNFSSEINWPKISIVTASYNQGEYIEETILSVLKQGYPNLEYIIIDGGSTDNSIDIIKKHADNLTYWVSEKDDGQADAINKGIKKCTGILFNWINSDDLLAKNALFIIANEYLKNPCAKLIAGGCAIIHNDNTLEYDYNKQNLTFDGLISEKSNFQQPTQWLNLKNNTIFLNPFHHYSFDWELILKLDLKESEIIYINKTLGYFRDHPKSKTNMHDIEFKREKLEIVKTLPFKNISRSWATLKYSLLLEAYLTTCFTIENNNSLVKLLFKKPQYIFSRYYMSFLIKSMRYN